MHTIRPGPDGRVFLMATAVSGAFGRCQRGIQVLIFEPARVMSRSVVFVRHTLFCHFRMFGNAKPMQHLRNML